MHKKSFKNLIFPTTMIVIIHCPDFCEDMKITVINSADTLNLYDSIFRIYT